MGIDPGEVYHIEGAHEKGVGEMDAENIEVVGEKVEEVRKMFRRA
jgi:hypothetical protein